MPTTSTEWLGDFTANTNTNGVQDEVRSFQLSNGNFWVTWLDHDSGAPAEAGGTDIVGQLYDPLGNAIGGPVRLNQGFVHGNEQDAAFAADIGTGQFYMIYETLYTSPAGPFTEIVIERHNADGSMMNGGLVVTDLTGDGSGIDVRNPEIAIAGAANGLLIWEASDDAGNTDIMGRFFNADGLSFTTPFAIWDQDDDSYDAEVTALANGNYAIVWTDEYNGSTTDLDIRGAIYSQAGTLVAALTPGYSTATETDSSIAALTGGGFVVSFTHTNASNNGDIAIRIYDAAGVAAGTAITIASGTDAQSESTVTATNDGGFVVTWSNATTGVTTMQSFTATGTPVGDPTVIAEGAIAPGSLSMVTLADGRILVSYDLAATGDAHAAIYDPRTGANAAAAYTPETWQVGTAGDDVFTVAPGAVATHGWRGDDVITDGSGTNTWIYGDAGNDRIVMIGVDAGENAHGGAGNDTLSFTGLGGALDVDLQAGMVSSATGATMTAASFENFETAAEMHAMTVRGTAGANRIVTGLGDDLVIGGAGGDLLDGGAGIDTLSYESSSEAVIVSLANGNAKHGDAAGDSFARFENLTGSAFGDKLTGDIGANVLQGLAGDDVINGGEGADSMAGGTGDDVYRVDNAGDVVVEAADQGIDQVKTAVDFTLSDNVEMLTLLGAARAGTGNGLDNTIFGSGGMDTLSGLSGADILRGNDGRDTLLGGDGADLLDGGVGKDTLTGGAARDVFQFRDGDMGANRSLADVITDFSHADAEKIALNLVDADATAAGNQAFSFIGSGAFTGVAGQLHYAQAGGNTYVEGDTNGDGFADFVIALTGTHSLVAADFVL